jgi:hypothetical protein
MEEKKCPKCGAGNPVSRLTCLVCKAKLGKAEKAAGGPNPFPAEKATATKKEAALMEKMNAVPDPKAVTRSEAAKKAWATKRKCAPKRKKAAITHKLTMNAFKGTLVECSCGAYLKVEGDTTAGEIAAWYHKHV